MTEYELLDLLAGSIDSMYDSVALYLSIVSGYLLVAYLAGTKLTWVQTGIISVLFVAGAGLQGWGLLSYQLANEEYMTAKAMISPLTEYQQGIANSGGGKIIASVMATGVVAALYFMWSVRHPRTE